MTEQDRSELSSLRADFWVLADADKLEELNEDRIENRLCAVGSRS